MLVRADDDQSLAGQQAAFILSQHTIEELEELAQSNNVAAAFALGHAFEFGIHTERDLSRAERYYGIAAMPNATERTYYLPPAGAGAGSTVTVPHTSDGLAAAKSALARVRRAPSAN